MKPTAVALFAVASILQLAHGIPTHRRLARHAVDVKEASAAPSGFQSYMPSQYSQFNPSQYGQYLSQYPSQLDPSQYLATGSSASAAETAAAASELHPSVAAKEGSTPNGIQSYIPSQFDPSKYNQINPSQLSQQYPSQFPSQFNPSQYLPSSSSASGAETAAAASELHPSVAAKEGSTPNGIQSYMPSQFDPSKYNQINPSQLSQQYPSQFPSQFNPSQYLPSSGAAPATSSSS